MKRDFVRVQAPAFNAANELTAMLNVKRKQFYKHLTHFRRVLRVAQGYGFGRADVPTAVREQAAACTCVDDVRALLRGRRIGYDISAYILRTYGGPACFVRFSVHEELLLQRLFAYVVYIFLRDRPDARSNFLNYAFTLRILAKKIGKNIDAQLPSIRSRSTVKKYSSLETWINAVLDGCPITMHDVVPDNLFKVRTSRRGF